MPPSSDRTRRRPSWSRMRRPTGRTRRPDAGGGCDDPALDGLVEQARRPAAAANLERAQAATREAQAQQQPSVGVNASPTFGHVSGLQELQPGVDPQPLVLLGRRQRVVPTGPAARSAARWKPRSGSARRYAPPASGRRDRPRLCQHVRRRHAAGVRPAFARGAEILAGCHRAPATRRTRHRAGRDPRSSCNSCRPTCRRSRPSSAPRCTGWRR